MLQAVIFILLLLQCVAKTTEQHFAVRSLQLDSGTTITDIPMDEDDANTLVSFFEAHYITSFSRVNGDLLLSDEDRAELDVAVMVFQSAYNTLVQGFENPFGYHVEDVQLLAALALLPPKNISTSTNVVSCQCNGTTTTTTTTTTATATVTTTTTNTTTTVSGPQGRRRQQKAVRPSFPNVRGVFMVRGSCNGCGGRLNYFTDQVGRRRILSAVPSSRASSSGVTLQTQNMTLVVESQSMSTLETITMSGSASQEASVSVTNNISRSENQDTAGTDMTRADMQDMSGTNVLPSLAAGLPTEAELLVAYSAECRALNLPNVFDVASLDEFAVVDPPPASPKPSQQPTAVPSEQPTASPSEQPTASPSEQPTASPSELPIPDLPMPSELPIPSPSEQPSPQPSNQPSPEPSFQPSTQPSYQPSAQPSTQPSTQPSYQPSQMPNDFQFESDPNVLASFFEVHYVTTFELDVNGEVILTDEDRAQILVAANALGVAYNILIQEFENPLGIHMDEVGLVHTSPVDEQNVTCNCGCAWSSVGPQGRRLQQAAIRPSFPNIRSVFRVRGSCNGCGGQFAYFTDQVGQRRLAELLSSGNGTGMGSSGGEMDDLDMSGSDGQPVLAPGIPTEAQLLEVYSAQIISLNLTGILDCVLLDEFVVVEPAPTSPMPSEQELVAPAYLPIASPSFQPFAAPTYQPIASPSPLPSLSTAPISSPTYQPVSSPSYQPVTVDEPPQDFYNDPSATEFFALESLFEAHYVTNFLQDGKGQLMLTDEDRAELQLVATTLELTYNELIKGYENPFQIKVNDVEIIHISGLLPNTTAVESCDCECVDTNTGPQERRLQQTPARFSFPNVRSVFRVRGSCNGCSGQFAYFTDQVGQRRTLAEVLNYDGGVGMGNLDMGGSQNSTLLMPGIPTEHQLLDAYSAQIRSLDLPGILDCVLLDEFVAVGYDELVVFGPPVTSPSEKPFTLRAEPVENEDISHKPSSVPSSQPSTTPSTKPSSEPSSQPSTTPSSKPSTTPSHQPSTTPSSQSVAAPELLLGPSLQVSSRSQTFDFPEGDSDSVFSFFEAHYVTTFAQDEIGNLILAENDRMEIQLVVNSFLGTYNTLVQGFENPNGLQMKDVQIMYFSGLLPNNERRRQLTSVRPLAFPNVRGVFRVQGSCNGCGGRYAYFTDQVGRRRALAEEPGATETVETENQDKVGSEALPVLTAGLPTEQQLLDAYSVMIKSLDLTGIVDVGLLREFHDFEVPPIPSLPPILLQPPTATPVQETFSSPSPLSLRGPLPILLPVPSNQPLVDPANQSLTDSSDDLSSKGLKNGPLRKKKKRAHMAGKSRGNKSASGKQSSYFSIAT